MKILFCNYEYPPLGGGGGIVNAALAKELARRHEVTVLTSRALGLPAEEVADDVRVIRARVLFRRRRAVANFPSMLAFLVSGALAGRKLLERERFDVINTHFALPTGPVGDLLSRAAGVPNVLSVHGGDLYDPSKRSSAHRHALLRAAVRRIALRADAVVAQSTDTLANLYKFFAAEAEVQSYVIPLGIARPAPMPASRARHGFAPDDLLLISVGRLIARKRVDQLIEAVADLADPRVKLVLVGDGPLAGELQAKAKRLQVEQRVRFMGPVDEPTKFELLSIGDLYVSTSQHEGFGLVFLEAMASGLPIVCYDRGGQSDFLADGETGYLVPVGDRAALVDRCRRLIADPALRTALGRANRQRVEDFYIDRCARRYEDVFEGVVRDHARNPRAAEVRGVVDDSRIVEGTK